MSGQKYPIDLLGDYPGIMGEFHQYSDSEISFQIFDLLTKRNKQKFESLSCPEPCQKQEVPVLCRGGRTSDTTQDMPLDQPPPPIAWLKVLLRGETMNEAWLKNLFRRKTMNEARLKILLRGKTMSEQSALAYRLPPRPRNHCIGGARC